MSAAPRARGKGAPTQGAARAGAPKKKKATPARRAPGGAPEGALTRWPAAALLAGLAGTALGWWASGRPLEEPALGAWLPLGLRDGATAALLFGPLCALARGRGLLGGLLGGLCGLACAGLTRPLGLLPQNWAVLLLGLALGGAAMAPSSRPGLGRLAMALALGGTALALGAKGVVWAIAAGAGLLGASWAPALLARAAGALRGLLLLLTVAGAAWTVNAGFTRLTLSAERAVLAEWRDPWRLEDPAQVRVLPGPSHAAFWTGGGAVVLRAKLDGPSFVGLPPLEPGPTPPERPPDARDLAELGLSVDCGELLEHALGGDARARVQAVLGRCDPRLGELAGADPVVDAARVLQGAPARKPVSIVAYPVELPLTEPEAVMLVAALRLEAPRGAAQALVDGSPYDRAVLLGRLEPADVAVLRPLIQSWSAEVPGPAGQIYRDALAALASATP